MTDRDTSKEHGERIAAREKANAPWDNICKATGKPKHKETQQELDIRQNLALRQVYDILYRHCNDSFSDPAKCQVFNECYENIKKYYEEQYK
jgi:hypothetical protein